MSNDAHVDIVVVSYNSRERLRACVEPLSHTPCFHVVVVDNASTDAGLETIRDLPVTVVVQDRNLGFANACNAGWRRGRAPYVLFVNPDAEISVDAAKTLVSALASNTGVGAAAPKIVDRDGNLDWSQRRFPRLRSTYANALFLNQLFRRAAWASELVRDPAAYERPGSPEWVSGACVLVRREALATVGGWDDGFFLYGEDKDLCRRLRAAGWDIRFVPDAVAKHEGGASAPRAELTPLLAVSRLRYARKHQGRIAAALERVGVSLVSLTHAVVGRGGSAARRGHLAALAAVIGVRAARRPDGAETDGKRSITQRP